jgi:hypothetical protein
MKSKVLLAKPNSAVLRRRPIIALKAKLPRPPIKLRTDQIMPLRHNLTAHLMLGVDERVNGKF